MDSRAVLSDPNDLKQALDRFFGLFRPTLDLVAGLVRSKSNVQEIILLLCARLDALASSISRQDQPNRQAFIHLVVDYAGDRSLMESVSVGDLYYELGYHRWLIDGLIPKPGRVHRFGRLNDPVIQLLDRSGVPITAGIARSFLTRIMKAISSKFRCSARQRLSKPMVAKPAAIVATLRAEFQGSKDAEILQNLGTAIQPLLATMTLAGILYDKFRNNAVHGIKVEIDEARFFTEREPFWQALYSEYYPPFLLVKFPAAYLVEMIQKCVATLRRKFLAAGKLPPDVHSLAVGYSLDQLDLLDTEMVADGTDLHLQLK
jgi:hypothetical protein